MSLYRCCLASTSAQETYLWEDDDALVAELTKAAWQIEEVGRGHRTPVARAEQVLQIRQAKWHKHQPTCISKYCHQHVFIKRLHKHCYLFEYVTTYHHYLTSLITNYTHNDGVCCREQLMSAMDCFGSVDSIVVGITMRALHTDREVCSPIVTSTRSAPRCCLSWYIGKVNLKITCFYC